MSPLFGVSQFTTTPWSFERDVEEYARLGVDAIEVCEDKLDKDRAREQIEFAVECGLRISSVQPAVRTIFPSRMQPDPVNVSERIARFEHTIDLAGEFAEGVPFVINTGPPPGGNIREAFDRTVKECRVLADFAGERGARIAIEPLSPALMNVESAIWTIPQAMRIVEQARRDNFGICLDFWNVWQNPNVLEEVRACGDRIFVVHISDWRTPRSFADRHVVGEGEIPTPALLRAVYESGYRGAYSLEIFSDEVPGSLWESDLSEVITRSRTGLEKAWQEAGLSWE